MTGSEIVWSVRCLINRSLARKEEQNGDLENCINYEVLLESLDNMRDEAYRYENILKIVKETDFFNAVSLNKIGEDYGYKEGIWEIAAECDFDPWQTAFEEDVSDARRHCA